MLGESRTEKKEESKHRGRGKPADYACKPVLARRPTEPAKPTPPVRAARELTAAAGRVLTRIANANVIAASQEATGVARRRGYWHRAGCKAEWKEQLRACTAWGHSRWAAFREEVTDWIDAEERKPDAASAGVG